MNSSSRSESGSVQIIEMTVILPLVCAVLILLIVAGFIVYCNFTMYFVAVRCADIAAMEYKIPGYVYYCCGDGSGGFGKSSAYIPDVGTVNTVSEIHSPYRYLSEGEYSDAGQLLEKYISGIAVLPGSFECSLSYTSHTGITSATAEITGYFLPFSMGIISLRGFPVKISASSSLSDNTELVRNTEFVYDLGDYLWNELQFGDDKQTLSRRVGSFSDYFKSLLNGAEW